VLELKTNHVRSVQRNATYDFLEPPRPPNRAAQRLTDPSVVLTSKGDSADASRDVEPTNDERDTSAKQLRNASSFPARPSGSSESLLFPNSIATRPGCQRAHYPANSWI
jgi:hypothetical protein